MTGYGSFVFVGEVLAPPADYKKQNFTDRRSGGGEQTNLDTCYLYLRGHTNKTKFVALTNDEVKLDLASP